MRTSLLRLFKRIFLDYSLSDVYRSIGPEVEGHQESVILPVCCVFASHFHSLGGEQNVSEIWNREELYVEIWEKPLVKLAAKYNISAVALGKACRKLQIPLPGRGYWVKKESSR
jgi:hypothetical protein